LLVGARSGIGQRARHLRVSIGNPDEMARFATAFKEIEATAKSKADAGAKGSGSHR
jgi:histidinol-phosphate/aromatic aminotransferase/cobyric acid decarboxylase-like protein